MIFLSNSWFTLSLSPAEMVKDSIHHQDPKHDLDGPQEQQAKRIATCQLFAVFSLSISQGGDCAPATAKVTPPAQASGLVERVQEVLDSHRSAVHTCTHAQAQQHVLNGEGEQERGEVRMKEDPCDSSRTRWRPYSSAAPGSPAAAAAGTGLSWCLRVGCWPPARVGVVPLARVFCHSQ